MTYSYFLGRALLAFVMALAVAGKITDGDYRKAFRNSLEAFTWVPRALRPALPAGVLAAEAALAVLLVLPQTAQPGLVLCALFLVVVTAALAAARAGGKDVRCACFGADDRPVEAWHFTRNGLLVLVAAGTFLAHDPAPATPVPAMAAGLVISAGLLCAVALTHWRELAYLFGTARSGATDRG
ncbi:MauE/DoxX family redox-associated membrane protein [Dactylosporangium sp. NPDC050588]|uniref:MauE/DoxX family redox-associated membrane protein n=1 Tax=Dactylosporangium sp. NPDC050588 TaxID=3157211 RepID=UPI003404FFAD